MKWLQTTLFTVTLKRLTRRILVVVLHTSLIGTIVLWSMLNPPFSTPTMQWITLITFLLIIVSSVLLALASPKWNTSFSFTRTKNVDERQTYMRNKVYFISYGLLYPAFFLLYLVNDRIGLGYLFLSASLFYWAIPISVLAWLEPDPIQDDFQGVEAVS